MRIVARNEALFKGEKIPFSIAAKATSEEIGRIRAKQVVIDSLTTTEMRCEDDFDVMQGLLGLVQGCRLKTVSP